MGQSGPDWCYVFFKESVTILMSCVKESAQMDVLLLYYLDFGIYIHILRTSRHSQYFSQVLTNLQVYVFSETAELNTNFDAKQSLLFRTVRYLAANASPQPPSVVLKNKVSKLTG